MKRIITIVKINLLLLVLLQAISCKKFLAKKSDTKLTTPDRVEDLQALLDRNDYNNFERIPAYGEVSSDDYFSFHPNDGAGEKGELAYTWQYFIQISSNGNDWQYGYIPVNIANICLEEIDKLSRTANNAAQWDNVKGSALFIRALNFLNLSWIYSKTYDPATAATDLGIALRINTDYDAPTVRASVEASYGQVIKDTKESLLYLPPIGVHPLRPSKAAAYGLLARAYLSMRIYDSAGVYADSCLQLRSELMDYNGDNDIVNAINGAKPPFRRYNKETIFYADMNTNFLDYVLRGSNVDTTLYEKYAADDLRKIAFFTLDVNGYQKFKGNYTQTSQIDERKFGGIATDEILLIRAEAYARKGMITAAMADLNALMIKRWKNTVPYPTITASDITDALKKILEERRKELLFRGLRWPDIKRLNKDGAGIVLKRIFNGEPYELLPTSNKYALPIPQDIIDMTGIPQNPGWL